MNVRNGTIVISLVVVLLAAQPALPIGSCQSCTCKDYRIVRYGNVYHSLGKPKIDRPNEVEIVPHAWPAADGTSRRLAAACDLGEPTAQAETYKRYTWSATPAKCTLTDITVNDALECEDSMDVPNLQGGADVTQKLCKPKVDEFPI